MWLLFQWLLLTHVSQFVYVKWWRSANACTTDPTPCHGSQDNINSLRINEAQSSTPGRIAVHYPLFDLCMLRESMFFCTTLTADPQILQFTLISFYIHPLQPKWTPFLRHRHFNIQISTFVRLLFPCQTAEVLLISYRLSYHRRGFRQYVFHVPQF
jgi:hypothetical protein